MRGPLSRRCKQPSAPIAATNIPPTLPDLRDCLDAGRLSRELLGDRALESQTETPGRSHRSLGEPGVCRLAPVVKREP